MDFFRNLFGTRIDELYKSSRRNPETNDEDFFNMHRTPDEQFPRKEDIFTDPLQMQQYFEQEMNNMLKLFGFQGFGEFSFGIPHVPVLEEPEPHKPEDVRDQFLKKGYEKPVVRNNEKVDKDLDGKIGSGNLDSILDGSFDQRITPYERPESRNFFFGKSESMKTVTNPDGSIETHHTVRDSEGNEETRVCHRVGTKEYCVIKKKDKSGKEEVITNFFNPDGSEKDISSAPNRNVPITDGHPNSTFPFDRFFK